MILELIDIRTYSRSGAIANTIAIAMHRNESNSYLITISHHNGSHSFDNDVASRFFLRARGFDRNTRVSVRVERALSTAIGTRTSDGELHVSM